MGRKNIVDISDAIMAEEFADRFMEHFIMNYIKHYVRLQILLHLSEELGVNTNWIKDIDDYDGIIKRAFQGLDKYGIDLSEELCNKYVSKYTSKEMIPIIRDRFDEIKKSMCEECFDAVCSCLA